MRLILLGPPGSGKGTQAKLLSQRLGLTHVGTGDILREAVKTGTPAGRRAGPFVAAGKLVPDDLVNDLIADRFRRDDRPEAFVMDGYPRTLAQAASFDQLLRQQFLDLDGVVFLVVDDDEVVRRLSGRWVCPDCKTPYHMVTNPPKNDRVCDNPKHPRPVALIQRDDDREETVRERLRVYHENTEDLIGHYRAKGLLRDVSGEGGIEAIFTRILEALKQQAKPPC
jgi:adenylate kinase